MIKKLLVHIKDMQKIMLEIIGIKEFKSQKIMIMIILINVDY